MYKEFNQSMKITVQINDYFNRYGVRSGEIELPAGATVADLLKSLGIPLSEIGFVVRNSTVLKETEQLRNGDVVLILPFVLGG
jgi:sulfur carrier protein